MKDGKMFVLERNKQHDKAFVSRKKIRPFQLHTRGKRKREKELLFDQTSQFTTSNGQRVEYFEFSSDTPRFFPRW